MNRKSKKESPTVLFCEFIELLVKNLREAEKFSTADSYHYAAVSFRKFLKGKDISMYEITPALIKEYENYLKAKGLSMNTISCYMRSLRAAFNRAVSGKVFIPKR